MISSILTVLVIGIISTAFVSASIYLRYLTQTNRLKTVLSIIMLVNGLFLLKDVIYYLPIQEGGHFYKFLLTTDNWAVSFDIVYFLELLRPGSLNYKKALLCVSPFVLLSVVFAITADDTIYWIISAFTYLYCLVCFIYVVYGVKKYWNVSKNLYSDLQRADIRWLSASIVILFLLFLLWQLLYFSGNDDYDIYYYVLMSLAFGAICRKTDTLEIPSEEEYKDLSLDFSLLPDAGKHDVRFAKELKSLEERGFFFNHPQLSLSELASELKTNRTTLSQYINRTAEVSYYDFINDIRLKEAVRLLEDRNTSLTQDDIAERAGFNSISTFRRAFVKKYKMSPQEYRKQVFTN